MTTGSVLIISHDVVGEHMAGPGIRYYQLARVLAREFEVVLAVPTNSTLATVSGFQVLPYTSGQDPTLEAMVRRARAMLVPAVVVNNFPILRLTETPIIIDGYDPFLAETLVMAREAAHSQQAVLTQACLLGDFFICASERQRDWWLGCLEANGRVNIHTHDADPSLRQLVDLVPFGLPENEPQHTRPIVKGVWPGVAMTDRVVLWGGGLWPWLDPLTAIRAMSHIARLRSDVHLIFPGTRHPNPAVAEGLTHTKAAKALASELGLLDKAVFFGNWVAYDDWPSVLLESDVALTLSQGDTLETRLAFRSRVLDYIWASLPIIASRGEVTSELIAAYNVGQIVDNTPEAVARALEDLLNAPRAHWTAAFAAAREALTWERAAQPLVAFCRQAHRAADRRHRSTPSKTDITNEEPKKMDIEVLSEQVKGLEWYHTIDLGQGVVTSGHFDHRPYLSAYGLPHSLIGKTVLDVGAASGFFSFEMERRGGQVTAVDLPDWAAHDFGPKYQYDKSLEAGNRYLHEPFGVAHQALGSHAKRLEMNIYDLTPDTIGVFDLVFCGSLLLHLTDPIKALWSLQRVTAQAAVIATVIAPDLEARPCAEFVGHYRGDGWWFPNGAGFEAMVQSAGFSGWEWFCDFRLDYRDGQVGPYHGVIRAWNTLAKPTWLEFTDSPTALLPRFVSASPALETELSRLQNQVNFYEQMKAVRLMRWLHPYHKALVEWWRRYRPSS